MHDVQLKFARERISEGASVSSRCLDADKDFAVLEREHVRRSSLVDELSMQRRHPAIRDKPNEDLVQSG